MMIAITALKGGVGKTTTAVHVAAYLQTKAPTLLIDADKNRSALVWSKEEKLPFMVASQAGSYGLIKRFEHIVLDVTARPEKEELKELAESYDLIILPTTPNHLDLDATLKAVDILNEFNANFKVLLTKVDTRTINGREAKKFLQEHNLPMFKTEITKLVAFERAPQRGVIIKDYPDQRAKFAWQQYLKVGKEISESLAVKTQPKKQID
jgi:chromosome partitioning protein